MEWQTFNSPWHLLHRAVLAILLATVPCLAQWTPPVGIPTPTFGLSESHWAYQDATYTFDYGNGPVPYRTNQFGPYTHFIDNTHPNSTDSDNPFGTPDRPRRTWVYPLPTGAAVQVHGGPYNFVNGPGSKLVIGGSGSQSRPIFFYGTTTNSLAMPTINAGETYFFGDWLVVDGLRFINSARTFTRPILKGAPIRNVAVRYCLFDGNGVAGNPTAFSTGGSSGSTATAYTENYLIFRNIVRNYGDAASSSENDACGVIASQHATNIWVLENDISDMGGDSIRLGADQGDTPSGSRYFVGRNKFYNNRENGIDVKQARDTVISENIIYGLRPTSSSHGTAIAIHYNPRNVWLLNNSISDSSRAVVSSGAQDVYILGNRIFNCDDHSLYLDRGGGTFYVINNTIDSCANGPYTSGTIDALHFQNNIVSGLTSSSGYHLMISGSGIASASTASAFLFNQAGGSLRIHWGGSTYNSVESWISSTGKGQASKVGDPAFLAGGSYKLSQNSPAIDAGVPYVSGLAELFQSRFGTSFQFDFEGNPRPSGSQIDIGAHEFATGSAANVPPSASIANPADGATFTQPTNITINATASDTDGSIARVDFYAGSLLIGSDPSSPYQVVWQDAPAGAHTLTAVATDNLGSTAASSPINITVTSPATNPPPANPPTTLTLRNGVNGYSGMVDTTIMSGSASTSFGSDDTLEIDGDPDSAALLKWDLSSIPAGAIATSVTLTFRVSGTSGQAYEVYTLRRAWNPAEATWTRASATAAWQTSGANGANDRDTIPLGSITGSSTGTRTVTLNSAGVAVVQGWINNPSSNHGFILLDYANSDGLDLSSSEASDPNVRPAITIAFEAAATNAAPIVTLSSPSDGASFAQPADIVLNANASDSDGSIAKVDFYAGSTLLGTDSSSPYSLTWLNAPAGSHNLTAVATDNQGATSVSAPVAVTVTRSIITTRLQNGVDGYLGMVDTKILSNEPSSNFGTQPDLEVDGDPDRAVLMKWDLSSIPSGRTVTSVTLTFNVLNASSQSYEFFAIKQPWNVTQATWLTAASGLNWQTPGAAGPNDRDSVILGSLTASSTGAKTVTLSAASIAVVQSWINDPSSNHGLILVDYANSDGLDLSSGEAGTISLRPTMTIVHQ